MFYVIVVLIVPSGSLPLHGEELPAGGFSYIPTSTKLTCDKIREVLGKIRDLNGDESFEVRALPMRVLQ